MTVKFLEISWKNIKYTGLSTDTKPTDCASGAIFFETDTGDYFLKIDSGWIMTKGHQYYGLSSDTKPTSPYVGSKYYETDTKKTYIYNGSEWIIEEAEIFDLTDYPVKAQGTVDEEQYDAEVVTVDADTDYKLLEWDSSDVFARISGNLIWVHYDINLQLKAGSGTADLKWQLWARNKGGTWTAMCAEQTADNIGTSYVDKRIAGLLDLKTNITTAPFEMKLTFQSNEATPGIATGKIRNDSVIRMVGEVT
jgi:hypothetical protein